MDLETERRFLPLGNTLDHIRNYSTASGDGLPRYICFEWAIQEGGESLIGGN